MSNIDLLKHVKAESVFIDDYPLQEGTLHAYIFCSSKAHAKIVNVDYSKAAKVSGVTGILTYKDIPGENQIGGIIQDEKLLADDEVDFIGQPIALIVAETKQIAKEASKEIEIDYELLEVITDPKEAFNKKLLIAPPHSFYSGDVDKAFKESEYVVEGSVISGAQEHLYLETQGSIAYKHENKIKIISSTQNPSAVQRVSASVLGVSYNEVEVDVLRLGGGFGGKEDQATMYAALAALAANHYSSPVKCVLSRSEDIYMTGKRHPYISDYKIGLSKEGKILAFESVFYQNSGAAADLSTAILDRTLYHAVNSYNIPNVKVTGYACKTNLPPNTAFRGFGGPQAMFVIESAIYKAAVIMKMEIYKIQEINLLSEGDKFYYGQVLKDCTAKKCWDELKKENDFQQIKNEIKLFNDQNKFIKKGFALMPICFGISFTNTFLNQANALVNIFTDGSVSLSSAAIEMGQGVNMKLRQIAQSVFSIDIEKIRVESTNTTRNSNTSATAASSGADLNGKAVELACQIILERLKKIISEENHVDVNDVNITNGEIFVNNYDTGVKWEQLIISAYRKRVNLSSHAHYATPGLNKENPFAYHVFGSALTIVSVDCLRGTYEVESVKIVHDFGKSINPMIDKGQVEGALMQGIGWMTQEEIVFDNSGNLRSNSLSTYKVPDIYFTPKEISIKFLESVNETGILKSKAIGEPPLMYGIGTYFALMNAIKEFNDKDFENISPLTNERVFLYLNKK